MVELVGGGSTINRATQYSVYNAAATTLGPYLAMPINGLILTNPAYGRLLSLLRYANNNTETKKKQEI